MSSTAPGNPAETDVWLGRPGTILLSHCLSIPVLTSRFLLQAGIQLWVDCPLWAEYNTMDGDGNPVDLSHRITDYYYTDSQTGQKVTGHSEKAVLSAEEAARYTVKNVLSGSDGWQPTLLCEACEAPVVKKINATLEWEKVPYAISYVVTAGDEVIGFTEKTSFEVPCCLSGCCASCAGCQ